MNASFGGFALKIIFMDADEEKQIAILISFYTREFHNNETTVTI